MERLKERIEIANKALKTLMNILTVENPTDVDRDATIQRFEYSFEATWKAAKRFLYIKDGIEANSPKAVIRTSFETKLLDEQQAKQALIMADDRNLTSHTYNEGLANELMSRMPLHATILKKWLENMGARL